MRSMLLLLGWLCLQQAALAVDSVVQSVRVKIDDGAEIHCLIQGLEHPTLTPLLFVPGYLMPADIFELQVQRFSKERPVVSMDPRSQGSSSKVSYGHYPARRAKDIKAVVDRFGLNKVVLVGWSLAAMEALSFYEQFPGNVEALVLIDGDLSYDASDQDAAREIRFLKAVSSSNQGHRTEALRAFVRSLYHYPPPAEHLAKITSSVLATSEDTSLALLVNRIGFHVRLDKVSVPVLVIVSDQNPAKEKVVADAKQIPGVQIHVFEQAGHALFFDKPEEFNKLLDEFLRHIPAARLE